MLRYQNIVFAALVFALALGGSARQGLMSDALPQIFSVITLFFVAQSGLTSLRGHPFQILCIATLIGVPLLQLLPLPPSIWLALPGREDVRALYSALEIEPSFHSLSLRPAETWRSFLSLLPALTLGLAFAALDLRSRLSLILVVLCFAAINVFVALAQIIGGSESSFYFYEITNRGRAVGLFANSNHYTAFLYSVIPFAAALFSGSSERRAPLRDIALAVSIVLLLIGLAISGSRTAVILGGVSLILSLILIAGNTTARVLSGGIGRAAAILSILVLLPVLFGIGLVQIVLRLQTQDAFSDLRFQILDTLLTTIRAYMPFGSGFGSFDMVYQIHEKLHALSPFYVKHAHNDVLELLIEGGALSAIALFGFGIGLMMLTFRALSQTGFIEERLEKACVVSLWLLVIHSFWDYPLRTIAVSSIFSISLGCLVKPTSVNAETIADVVNHYKETRMFEWIEALIGGQPRRRRRRRKSPSTSKVARDVIG